MYAAQASTVGTVLLTEAPLCRWVGVKMISVNSLVPREGSLCLPLFSKHSQKRKQSPLICPRLPSDPCLHPWSKLSAHPVAQCSSVLSQACWLGFKTPHFRYTAWCQCARILWGRVSPGSGWCRFVPERQVHECTGAWSVWLNAAKSWHPG